MLLHVLARQGPFRRLLLLLVTLMLLSLPGLHAVNSPENLQVVRSNLETKFNSDLKKALQERETELENICVSKYRVPWWGMHEAKSLPKTRKTQGLRQLAADCTEFGNKAILVVPLVASTCYLSTREKTSTPTSDTEGATSTDASSSSAPRTSPQRARPEFDARDPPPPYNHFHPYRRFQAQSASQRSVPEPPAAQKSTYFAAAVSMLATCARYPIVRQGLVGALGNPVSITIAGGACVTYVAACGYHCVKGTSLHMNRHALDTMNALLEVSCAAMVDIATNSLKRDYADHDPAKIETAVREAEDSIEYVKQICLQNAANEYNQEKEIAYQLPIFEKGEYLTTLNTVAEEQKKKVREGLYSSANAASRLRSTNAAIRQRIVWDPEAEAEDSSSQADDDEEDSSSSSSEEDTSEPDASNDEEDGRKAIA